MLLYLGGEGALEGAAREPQLRDLLLELKHAQLVVLLVLRRRWLELVADGLVRLGPIRAVAAILLVLPLVLAFLVPC